MNYVTITRDTIPHDPIPRDPIPHDLGARGSARHETAECVVENAMSRKDFVAARLAAAKRSFVTRNADLSRAARLDNGSAPQAGDLVLARVLSIGHHARLESPAGRRQTMYAGDEIIVAYGNRYAPDQFMADVPGDLGECDLVAGGGIASRMIARHRSTRNPTRIEPIGLIRDEDGKILNLAAFRDGALGVPGSNRAAKVIVIVGTSMNAGKTTTAARLVHGLAQAGLRVGTAKVTGTGSGGDIWSMLDAGAQVAYDFTDAGYATTAKVPLADLTAASCELVELAAAGNDIAVIEVADGLLQAETSELLRQRDFAGRIDHVFLAAGDAMGAAFGHQWLKQHGLPISLIAGCVSSSPLGRSETEQVTGLRVATLEELSDAGLAPSFCFAPAPVI